MNEERNVPESISVYFYSEKRLDIRYDKAIDEKDKIPGLVEFLEYEYEQLLESKGSFILDEDLSEDDVKPIPVILSSECPVDKKRYTMSDDWIAKTIVRELQKEYSEDEKEEKEEIVKRILKDRSFNTPIAGMYFHNSNQLSERDIPGPYIELYYRNTYCPDEEDYKAFLSACLAHEYFHFLQYSCLGIDINKKRLKKQVVESTADFFSLAYCLSKAKDDKHRSIKKEALKKWAEERFTTWRYRFGSGWPYAFAYCFAYGNHYSPMNFSDKLDDYKNYGCIDRFNWVMECSKRSLIRAYDALTENCPI